jgi:Ca-activated chloride channel family protein
MKQKTCMKFFPVFICLALLAAWVLAAAACGPKAGAKEPGKTVPEKVVAYTGPKVDDWQFTGPAPAVEEEMKMAPMPSMAPSMAPPAAAPAQLGFSVGGAKDINNFRENIANNYLPTPTDITYEGLFYDYTFDTGKTETCKKLFCASYSYAVSRDPISKTSDVYLSVGLNSGIKESDFQRKKLNLVIVLDISGSMGSPFDRYYYDQFGNQHEVEGADEGGASKLQIAAESIAALLDHLKPGDSFGMVLFDDASYLAKPLSPVERTDMEKIKEHVKALIPCRGTNMQAGMNEGTALFEALSGVDFSEYENRIIFLTDAMPNLGDTSEGGLRHMMAANAEHKLYTTFIGMGVDLNTELIEVITKIRGANYYSVHSSKEFKKRMDEEFEFMVTPLVFNLQLKLEAEGYKIEKVYGSPEANEATGEIMKVNTLFPSKTEAGETRGGLVLLRLKKVSSSPSLTLKVSYEDRKGVTDGDEKKIKIPDKDKDVYPNTGIRKGILLSRYADLVKDWIIDETGSYKENKPLQPSVDAQRGIVVPDAAVLSKWERQSIPLRVSDAYKKLFGDFKTYFGAEMKAIGDGTLDKELKVLDKLINFK